MLRRRLDERIALRDDAILRTPAFRAPAADREAAVERRVEGGSTTPVWPPERIRTRGIGDSPSGITSDEPASAPSVEWAAFYTARDMEDWEWGCNPEGSGIGTFERF